MLSTRAGRADARAARTRVVTQPDYGETKQPGRKTGSDRGSVCPRPRRARPRWRDDCGCRGEADVAPGLIHHHFSGKEDLISSLVKELLARFRVRVRRYEESDDPLHAYADGALKLDAQADVVAARCWVGVFAEAVRNPTLFAQVRRLLDGEVEGIKARSGQRFSTEQASAVLAYIVGSLVVGAFAPKKAAGFAAPGLRALVDGMLTGPK